MTQGLFLRYNTGYYLRHPDNKYYMKYLLNNVILFRVKVLPFFYHSITELSLGRNFVGSTSNKISMSVKRPSLGGPFRFRSSLTYHPLPLIPSTVLYRKNSPLSICEEREREKMTVRVYSDILTFYRYIYIFSNDMYVCL